MHVNERGDLWTYPDDSSLGSAVGGTGVDITGFDVEALDGSIGSIDEATYDVSRSYIVVDTGPWIFGKKVMLPAGIVQSVDEDEEVVYVDRTKEQIKNAPELDESVGSDDMYRSSLDSYYGPGGSGYRERVDAL